MQSFYTINYKYQHGVYSIQNIIELVKQKVLTEEEFKDITSYNYKGYIEQKKGTD